MKEVFTQATAGTDLAFLQVASGSILAGVGGLLVSEGMWAGAGMIACGVFIAALGASTRYTAGTDRHPPH